MADFSISDGGSGRQKVLNDLFQTNERTYCKSFHYGYLEPFRALMNQI